MANNDMNMFVLLIWVTVQTTHVEPLAKNQPVEGNSNNFIVGLSGQCVMLGRYIQVFSRRLVRLAPQLAHPIKPKNVYNFTINHHQWTMAWRCVARTLLPAPLIFLHLRWDLHRSILGTIGNNPILIQKSLAGSDARNRKWRTTRFPLAHHGSVGPIDFCSGFQLYIQNHW